MPDPFRVRDCALTVLSAGFQAENPKELHDGLLRVPAASLYQHFWGRLLQPRFDDPEYNNDFASWAYHGLHEKPLAERLSVIDPAEYDHLEALRQVMAEVLEQWLDLRPFMPWTRTDQQFYFLRSQMVVFDADLEVTTPAELARALPQLSTGSVFYHFIDARRRTPERVDDFTAWLRGFGSSCAAAVDGLHRLDPYFSSLEETRRLLARVLASLCADGAQQGQP